MPPRTRSLEFLLPLAIVFAISPTVSRADVAVPARLMQPATPAEAWNVIRLATANLDRLFAEDRVEEVKDQAVLLSPSLRLLAREGALEGGQEAADRMAGECFGLVNLLVRESMAGNLEGARNVFSRLGPSLDGLGGVFDPALRLVEIHSCVDHPEVAEPDPSRTCPVCDKRLHPRRFPYSAFYVEVEEPTLRLDMKTRSPLEAGRKAAVQLRLALGDGRPATEADLVLVHAGRLHLLLIDETGEDFHHLVPRPGNEPGIYEADFVPSRPVGYLAWVEAIPAATRMPESLAVRLPGKEEGVEPPFHENLSVEGEGLEVRLAFPGPGPARLKAGRTHLVQVHFSESGGRPLTRLEPIWNAFAHLTLVAGNSGTAFQVHPLGGELLNENLRGGPTLAFKLRPPAPGLWRVFCQVRVDGGTRTFPMALKVEP